MLTSTNNRPIGVAALLLALAFLAWVLWSLWLRGDELVKQRNSVAGGGEMIAAIDTGPAQYNIGQIVSSHLFGTKIVKAAPVVAPVTVAPPTNLRLRLVGILSTDNDNGVARALIALESGIAKSYAVGDAIERTDSTLHAVETSRVLLDRNGRIEALELQRKVLPPEGSGPANQRQPRGRTLG